MIGEWRVAHVHVRNADGRAKFYLEPETSLFENRGIKNKDIKLAETLINENKDLIIKRWKDSIKQTKTYHYEKNKFICRSSILLANDDAVLCTKKSGRTEAK